MRGFRLGLMMIIGLLLALPASAVTLVLDNGDVFAIGSGDVFDNVVLFDTADVTMDGGAVNGHFLLLNQSTATISGGTIGNLEAFGDAFVTVVIQSGTLEIDGLPEPEPRLLTDADCSACTVSATLADGTPVGPAPVSVLQSGQVEIVAVPEPTTAGLMALGLMGLAVCTRTFRRPLA